MSGMQVNTLSILYNYSRIPLFQIPLGQLNYKVKELSLLNFRGSCTLLYVAGTMHSVLIKGGVLTKISGKSILLFSPYFSIPKVVAALIVPTRSSSYNAEIIINVVWNFQLTTGTPSKDYGHCR